MKINYVKSNTKSLISYHLKTILLAVYLWDLINQSCRAMCFFLFPRGLENTTKKLLHNLTEFDGVDFLVERSNFLNAKIEHFFTFNNAHIFNIKLRFIIEHSLCLLWRARVLFDKIHLAIKYLTFFPFFFVGKVVDDKNRERVEHW